jgi:hypothetical protein
MYWNVEIVLGNSFSEDKKLEAFQYLLEAPNVI